MKIGIILSYISKNPAGLERYVYELVHNLTEIDQENAYHIYTKRGTSLRSLEFLNGLSNVKIIKVGGGKFWKDIGLMFAVRSDVYIFTGPIGPLFFRPKRSLTIVYDFSYKVNSHGIRNYLTSLLVDLYSWRMFSLASKIVCISRETKKELLKYFKVNGNKLLVIYPGFNKICSLSERRVDDLPENFFFSVGTIKDRKNAFNIIRGFSEFIKSENRDTPYCLLLVGKYSKDDVYYLSLLNFIIENGLESKVKFLGHIDDEELCYLYKRARALVYPSFLEGFGLPILEAMDCGVPVITSNLSSLAEVAGDSALLVNPSSFVEIGQAMRAIAAGGFSLEALIKKGHSRASLFSWRIMSLGFLNLINEICHE